VILVGEMRDLENDFQPPCWPRENGPPGVLYVAHPGRDGKQFSVLSRVFPPPEQKQIRLQMAATLKACGFAAPGAPRR